MMRRALTLLLIVTSAVAGSLFFNEAAEAQPFGPRIEWPDVSWFTVKKPQLVKPFRQNHAEELRIAGILKQWEAAGRNTRSFSCRFTQWQYDFAFGPRKNDFLHTEVHGRLKYRAPASAAFVETDSKTYDVGRDKYVRSPGELEHWLCDNERVFWLHPNSQSIDVIFIPPSWKNRATVDGPLPFFFPIDSAALLKRFWFRETTPSGQIGKQLWLTAWPTSSAEAAVVRSFEIILNLPELSPIGLQVTLPCGDRTAYLFEDFQQNAAAAVGPNDFQPPQPAASWKRQHFSLPISAAKAATPAPSADPQTPDVLAAPGEGAASTACCRQNRSRANGGRLVHSRPGFSRFGRQGRVSCRIRYCGRFRRCCR